MIDLRSDTVTRPDGAMLQAMMAASVGDDVYGEDPTVKALEEKAAGMFGKEAAIFCPSGTMTNQIAIKLLTQPQDELICHEKSHIYNYEGGGIAFHAQVATRTISGESGKLAPDDVRDHIRPDDIHYASTSLVCLENTVNKAGGICYRLEEMQAIHQVCLEHGLALHLDGARVWNAMVAQGDSPADYGACFDTLSICLSKGLGAPVGSLLLGTEAHIHKARRLRKVMGGGMRQAGFLAAAGIYALENNIDRLQEDHARAKKLAGVLENLSFTANVRTVETNIILWGIEPTLGSIRMLKLLNEAGILASGFGKNIIRLVTHLDFNDDDLGRCIYSIENINV